MATSLDRLLILGLDGATWTVLDPMRRRGPDAEPRRPARRGRPTATLALDRPAGHHGRLDDA